MAHFMSCEGARDGDLAMEFCAPCWGLTSSNFREGPHSVVLTTAMELGVGKGKL